MRTAPLFFFLSILLSCLIFLPIALAEFSAIGEPSVQLAACGTTTRILSVTNLGTLQSSYDLSVDDSGSDFVTFSTTQFLLEPQSRASIITYYSIPCDTSFGTYPLKIYFNDGADEQELSQDIIILPTFSLNATALNTTAVIPPCGTAHFGILLQNPSNITETDSLETSGHPDIHLSQETAILEPLQERTIDLSVTPSDCTIFGTSNLALTITAQKSQLTQTLPFELIITPTDIPLLAPGVSSIRTDYVDSTAPLTIKNIGDRLAHYQLQVSGVSFATITPQIIAVAPGETQTALLHVHPTKTIPARIYPITLSATVQESGLNYTKELTIFLQPPTAFERNPVAFIITLVIFLFLLFGIIFLTRTLRSPAFHSKLAAWKKQRAERKKLQEEARLAREKKNQQEIEKQAQKERAATERKFALQQRAEQARIRAEERKAEKRAIAEKKLANKVEQELRKNYYFVSRKEIPTPSHTSSSGKSWLAFLFILLLVLVLSLTWNFLRQNLVASGIGIALLFIILVISRLNRRWKISRTWKNLIPERAATIQLWKAGLTSLIVNSDKPAKKFTLIVKRQKVKTPPSPLVYETFNISSNSPAYFNATFIVSDKFLKKNGVTKESLRLVRKGAGKWTTVPLSSLGHSKTTCSLSATLTFGTYCLFAIAPKKKPVSHAKFIVPILTLVLIIAAAIFLALPQNTANGVIPPQIWKQGTIHELNLAVYFKDPDNDSLTYGAVPTEHVTIDIIGSRVILTAQNDFVGEEFTRFSADDGKGGKITSNSVALRVQKNVLPAVYHPFVAILLAVLAILVLLWIVFLQRE